MRFLTSLCLLAGCVSLIYLAITNGRMSAEVGRLEAELGKLAIKNPKGVHIIEVAKPDVPPEVAAHIAGIWQFRCYLPPGYDYMKMSGAGRVTKEGMYLSGGHSSGWSTPNAGSSHDLLTVCLQRKDNYMQVFYSYAGFSGTTSWHSLMPDRVADMVVQKLANSQNGTRSFDQHTILPVLKIYDPATAHEDLIAGKATTTYAGGYFVFSPKSHERHLDQLRNGELPVDFKADWIATAVGDE